MSSGQKLSREETLRQLSAAPLDLLVIGGGIVGSGVARDAALRGLKIGLIDRRDFAFGTSSRSSRLLHGGIRYLAQGRVGLVREASLEKTILHRIAPHLAAPLAFVFPAYRGTSWPFWQLRIGVKIYDLLCGGRNLGRSRTLRREEIFQKAPGLIQDGLAGAVRYYDGLTQDARLVLDTLRSAGEAGAILANYTEFKQSERVGKEFTCEVTDELTGRAFQIKTRAIVNATGPWSQQLGCSEVKLRLTKGIHLVFQKDRLPVEDAVVITEGTRVLFVIPWGERIIVGTTDTDFDGPPDSVRTERKDIDYLLQTANRFFPKAKLVDQDIISTWAGLRPLIADSRGGASDISRSHRIAQPHPGWWDVAGGKLTTYRLMAEQTVDQVVSAVGVAARKCSTAERPLLPTDQTEGISQIVPPVPSRELVEHFCRNEWAIHLDDVMVRRSSWHYYDPNPRDLAAQVGTWMAEILGWSPERKEEEWQRYLDSCDWTTNGPDPQKRTRVQYA